MCSEAQNNKDFISLLSAKTNYVIDDVIDLLQNLLETSQDELTTLEADWPGIQAEKLSDIDFYIGLVNEKNSQCFTSAEENTELTLKIDQTQAQINENQQELSPIMIELKPFYRTGAHKTEIIFLDLKTNFDYNSNFKRSYQ